jgi:hypothetical protein
MARLDVQRIGAAGTNLLVLRSGPNWTAVLFFACLSALHLFIVLTSFLHQRWEAFMSVIFGVTFALVSLICWRVRQEVAVLGGGDRRVRVRTGSRRIYLERFVSFSRVRCVRLTLLNPRSPESAHIELVCEHEVIDCPPTTIPREEALCLAVLMGVRLVKVYGEGYDPVSERLDAILSSPPPHPEHPEHPQHPQPPENS